MGKELVLSPLESLYATKPYFATEKLRLRCKEVGIDPPTTQPVDNNVIVWRLPPLKMSSGGIVIPEESQSPHIKGILMAMGPRARDVLYSNGIEEGDVVTWARFSGDEHKDKTANRILTADFITLKDRDILGSDDLRVAMATGKAKYVLDSATGRWSLQRKLLSGKKEKLLARAASTDNPHEAETARRIAAGMK
jgi:co-chaperonin GroES (HSP10)